jgi:hypothetical protein
MAKDGMEGVRSSFGLRFGRALDQSERPAVERALASAGAGITSWLSLPDIARTFAVAAGPAAFVPGTVEGAEVDAPPLCVLAIRPADRAALGGLLHAFGGPGRPGGVREALDASDRIVVVWDDGVSPLSLLIDLADAETRGRRRIEPLLPLSDRSIARLAGDLLGLRDFDESRLVETHLAACELKQA